MRDSAAPARLGLTAPLLPVVALIVLGILLARAVCLPGWPAVAMAAAALLVPALIAVHWGFQRSALLALGCVFVLAGAVLELREQDRFRQSAAETNAWRDNSAAGKYERLEGMTLDLPRPTPARDALEGVVMVDRIWRHGREVEAALPVLLRVYVPHDWPGQWRRGDRIQCLARLTLPRGFRNEGTRPAGLYYWNRNIRLLGSCKSPGLFSIVNPASEGWRDLIARRLDTLIHAESGDFVRAEVLGALLLGSNISTPELRSAYIDAGIYHLLVISGTHFTLIALFVGGLLALLPLPAPMRHVLLLVVLSLYLVLVQYHVSVVRAFIIAMIYILGRLLNRPAAFLNAIALAALILLAWQPWFLFDAGFQLTFSAVCAIALVGRPLTQAAAGPLQYAAGTLFSPRIDLDPSQPHRAGRRWRYRMEWLHFRYVRWWAPAVFGRWVGRGLRAAAWTVSGLCASLAVLMVSLPVLAALHFPLPLSGTVLTLVATTLVWPIMILLLLAVPLAALGGTAAGMLIQAAGWLAGILNMLVDACRWPPLWMIPPGGLLAACYLTVLLLCFAIKQPRHHSAFIISVLMLVTLVGIPLPGPDGLHFSVLDVGEGDSLLLRTPEGDNVMVDTGGTPSIGPPNRARDGTGDLSRRVLIPTLLEKGIRRLDALVITHFDTDHAGSAIGLLRAFPVNALLVSDAEWRRQPPFADELAAQARLNRLVIRPLAAGDTLRFHSLTLRVLHPGRGKPDSRANANSLVLEGQWRDHRILLTGDIEAATEQYLAEAGRLNRCAIMKSPHHGSQTSSTPALLRSVDPSLVLISSGSPWRFNHPSPRVIARLESRGIPNLTTHRHGEILVRFHRPGLQLSFPGPDVTAFLH
ncbi:MAG TPA: ComEC/Rec2 family competence protein [Acidobacteriota bacterium]|nr:ComEC/Rec2 family competence protein [Acidobacteriota bacterium]